MIDSLLEFNFTNDLIIQDQDRTFLVNWVVPKNLSYFQGHFPGSPILPAVAIIDASLLVITLIRSGVEAHLQEIKSAKFFQPITPLMNVKILFTQRELNHWRTQWMSNLKTLADLDLSLLA